jgi:hypothetical protein
VICSHPVTSASSGSSLDLGATAFAFRAFHRLPFAFAPYFHPVHLVERVVAARAVADEDATDEDAYPTRGVILRLASASFRSQSER